MYSRIIVTNFFVLSLVICVLTSCIKYQDVVKSEFPQGKKKQDGRDVVYGYRRSTIVYDEFTTKAIFDALWLSDIVRTAYVDVYADKRGFSAEAKETLLRREIEENRHWLTVYLLADLREKTYTLLNEKNATWSMFVKIDNNVTLVPELIKEIEIEPEYQVFFGSQFNLFKTAYIIKVPLTEIQAEHIASGAYEKIALVIGSMHKECIMEWKKSSFIQPKKVLSDEDFYWG